MVAPLQIGGGISFGGGITVDSGSSSPAPADLLLSLDAGNPASYPGSGSTWTDTTGGKTFALTGSPAYSSNNGGYLSFNGSSQYAYASTPLATLNTWTLESWYFYNSTAGGQNSQIITDALGTAINYRLGYQASGAFVSAGLNRVVKANCQGMCFKILSASCSVKIVAFSRIFLIIYLCGKGCCNKKNRGVLPLKIRKYPISVMQISLLKCQVFIIHIT